MQEFGRDLGELKREVIEARNQAIKTDNQVKNLAIDVKSFEKRFDTLERRTRMASVSVNVIIAVVILVAAYIVYGMRARALETSLHEAQAEAAQARTQAEGKAQSIGQRLAELEQASERRVQAETIAVQILARLDAKQEKEAAELLDKANIDAMGPLGKEVAGKRIPEFKRRMADNAFKAARTSIAANRLEPAVPELKRAMALDPDGKTVPQARYALASTLYNLKRFDEAVPLLKEVLAHENDKAIAEEGRFLLATALARLGQRDDATKALKEIAASNNRYTAVARTYLTALEAGSDLPPLVDKKSPPTASRPAGPTAPVLTPTIAKPAP